MDELVKGLAPAFAAGLGVQRLLEVIDAIFNGFPKLGDRKKLVMACASIVLAAGISWFGGIRILIHLPVGSPAAASAPQLGEPQKHVPDYIDLIVTILFISGGTEGFNSLLKLLNYKKEESKGSAANALADTEGKKIKGADALFAVRST